MDRSVLKWLALGLALFLFMRFGWPAITGKGNDNQVAPIVADWTAPPEPRAEEQTCEIHGQRFDAVLSSRGASLRKTKLLNAKYHSNGEKPVLSPETGVVSTSKE